MIKSVLLSITVTLFLSSSVGAVEVRNLLSGQNGKRAFLQYDLVGKLGEKDADVALAIEVGGEKYPAKKLTLSGDFGKGVKIGVGRKVFWDVLKDLPAGFDGEIGWDIEATSTEQFLAVIKTEEAQSAKERAEQKLSELLKADEERLAQEKTKKEQAVQKERPAVSGYFKTSGLTVLDTKSGMMWVRTANIAGKKLTYDYSAEYAKKMNSENYGGYSDWRIPSRKEFHTLIVSARSLAKKNGKTLLDVFKEHFNDYPDWNYWTGEIVLGSPYSNAYSFDIERGSSKIQSRNDDLYILPVRGTYKPD